MAENENEISGTPCILAVDDEKMIRDLIKAAMDFAGYQCLTAEGGEEALKIMETTDVDIVITDIMMPQMEGLELTLIIRKKYNADVIVMTGFLEDYTYEETIDRGASDFIQKPVSINELIVRVKRLLRERQILAERNMAEQALRDSEKRFQELSITDGLTGLFNSRHFYSQLQNEVDRYERYKRPLTMLLLDIDNFKNYNDSYGHLEGDIVLMRLAEVINRCLRKTDSAYRYGGEEFVIILPETSGEQGQIIAERIREEFKAEVFNSGGVETHVTVSIGVTQYLENDSLTSFINRADKCMYTAKWKGRDRVIFSMDPS